MSEEQANYNLDGESREAMYASLVGDDGCVRANSQPYYPCPEATLGDTLDLGLHGETYTNPQGGKQTKLVHNLEALPWAALVSVGRVIGKGMAKYGKDNWHQTTVDENLNHAIGHIAAYCEGNRGEPNLAHAACRLLFALWLEIRDQDKLDV